MLKDISPDPRSGAITRARKLRRRMSLPEVLLWQQLRGRPCDLKFRRQHPSGPYIVDFFCADARLAIEIDGESHAFADRGRRDVARDAWFASAGITTLRIPAKDVLSDLPAVVDAITASACSRLPLHHPAAPGGPPPRDKLGEE
jgi:very-short-patch-repair endonuclease